MLRHRSQGTGRRRLSYGFTTCDLRQASNLKCLVCNQIIVLEYPPMLGTSLIGQAQFPSKFQESRAMIEVDAGAGAPARRKRRCTILILGCLRYGSSAVASSQQPEVSGDDT